MTETSRYADWSFDHQITIESFGLAIRLESNEAGLLRSLEELARRVLLGDIKIIENNEPVMSFAIGVDHSHERYILFNDDTYSHDSSSLDIVLELFVRLLRLFVAEFARDRVFVHAGVVEWKGKAIVIPANSGMGKTTLVVEFVKQGAVYFSDEYAIFDESGYVHPFTRDLSVRSPGKVWSEKNGVPVEHFGGTRGVDPIPVGLVVLTEYAESSVWQPELLSYGRGIIEMVQHTISLNAEPEFSLKVLKSALENAIILKCLRGDAREAAKNILSFCDNSLH
ncbi:MAG: hypothetical protein H0V76_05645 [Blastocatellia bacterium]|nr:hypothetical protein [Blastocatellia bacterium]